MNNPYTKEYLVNRINYKIPDEEDSKTYAKLSLQLHKVKVFSYNMFVNQRSSEEPEPGMRKARDRLISYWLNNYRILKKPWSLGKNRWRRFSEEVFWCICLFTMNAYGACHALSDKVKNTKPTDFEFVIKNRLVRSNTAILSFSMQELMGSLKQLIKNWSLLQCDDILLSYIELLLCRTSQFICELQPSDEIHDNVNYRVAVIPNDYNPNTIDPEDDDRIKLKYAFNKKFLSETTIYFRIFFRRYAMYDKYEKRTIEYLKFDDEVLPIDNWIIHCAKNIYNEDMLDKFSISYIEHMLKLGEIEMYFLTRPGLDVRTVTASEIIKTSRGNFGFNLVQENATTEPGDIIKFSDTTYAKYLYYIHMINYFFINFFKILWEQEFIVYEKETDDNYYMFEKANEPLIVQTSSLFSVYYKNTFTPKKEVTFKQAVTIWIQIVEKDFNKKIFKKDINKFYEELILYSKPDDSTRSVDVVKVSGKGVSKKYVAKF